MFDKVIIKKSLEKMIKKVFGVVRGRWNFVFAVQVCLCLLLLLLGFFFVYKYYPEIVSFSDVHCLGRRNINYIKISYGYKTKNQFMWIQVVHSLGDLKPLLNLDGVRVGSYTSSSTFLWGCSPPKKLFFNNMQLMFEPDVINKAKFLVTTGVINFTETADSIKITNLGEPWTHMKHST